MEPRRLAHGERLRGKPMNRPDRCDPEAAGGKLPRPGRCIDDMPR